MTTKQAILATLVYHDIFDYPLTAEEIHKYLVKKESIKSISSTLVILEPSRPVILERSDRISNDTTLYALPGRKNLFITRKTRQKISEKKLKRARFYSRILSIVPYIHFIGISGALAMQNSHKNDDIDLVIICRKGTLWTTRFLANIILLPFRRFPNSKNVSNRACLNIFIDESNLAISARNLYTAHEICQLKPIVDKYKTYSKLIKSNEWIKKFLPNWLPYVSSVIPAFTLTKEGKTGIQRKRSGEIKNFQFVEIFLKKFQLAYMRSKISTERIGEYQLFFHPQNTQGWVLKEYQKKLKQTEGKIKATKIPSE